jgi:hypothetical protein
MISSKTRLNQKYSSKVFWSKVFWVQNDFLKNRFEPKKLIKKIFKNFFVAK